MPFKRILPWVPHVLFAILEPVMTVLGAYSAISSPQSTLTDQIPPLYQTGLEPVSPATTIILHQLANVYLLVGTALVLILWTSNPSTARYFLVAVGLGDLGHIYASYAGMGPVMFWDVASWNVVLWANVGVSLFLLGNRVLTILGVWGSFRGEERAKRE